MKKNNRGFTLIEVLVAITIMGIITVMALPGVQQLQAQNRERKYEKYGESLVDSAKLYVDSNEEDIFGYSVSGCVDIPYSELEAKALVKDYSMNGVTCANSDTFIHIEKKGDKYVYKPYITCMKNGKIEYQTTPNVAKCNNETTTGDGSGVLSAKIVVDDADNWTKQKKVTVEVETTSSKGLMINNRAKYCLATYDSAANIYNCVSEKEDISLSSTGGTKVSAETKVGNGLSGKYYFVLFTGQGQVADYDGNQLSIDVVSKELKLDNTPPTITKIEEGYHWILLVPYSALDISYINEPEGSDIEEITYSYDNFSDNKKITCQILDLIGLGCSFEKNPYVMAKRQFDTDTYDIVYFRITDKAGNSSTVQYNFKTETIS